MSDDRKTPLSPWIVALLIGLPVPYVLSSKSMLTVVARHQTVLASSKYGAEPIDVITYGTWWPKAYAPLVWISEQPWEKPVNWYWNQLPIREIGD